MSQFARWHIWLGWLAALPILLWLVSGLFMAAKPIAEVRGDHLRRPPVPVSAKGLVLPQVSGAIAKVTLLDQAGRATWVVTNTDKVSQRFDATTGAVLGAVDEAEARRIALAAFAGPDGLQSIRHFGAEQSPIDLRRQRASWQATFADGTHLYIDAGTGEVMALRTRWWRAYDLLWGFHIMDLEERENANNPWIWTLGGLALLSSLLGSVLLFRRRRRAR